MMLYRIVRQYRCHTQGYRNQFLARLRRGVLDEAGVLQGASDQWNSVQFGHQVGKFTQREIQVDARQADLDGVDLAAFEIQIAAVLRAPVA